VSTRLIARDKFWILACSLVFFEVVISLTIPHSHALTAAGDLNQCVLLAVVLICVVVNVKNSDPRARLFWILVSLACALWLSAQILWTYYEVFLRREVPNPSAADVILFLHLVPLMGALAMRPHLDRDEHTAKLGVLDFALLVTWWLYLFLFLAVPWQYIWPDPDQYGRAFDFVYCLEHLVFLICAGAAWYGSSGAWKTIYGHLLGAGLLYALASIGANVAIDFGKYYTGSVYDAPLVVAMAWFAAVGLMARKLTQRADPPKGLARQRDLLIPGLAMFSLLSLPAMAAWAVYVSQAPAAVRGFRLMLTLVAMLVMGGLAWIKQYRLGKELAHSNRELREDSFTDLLTGARNRRFLANTIQVDVRHVMRAYSPAAAASQNKRNRDLIFYVIDADTFKEVNDGHGHDVGDKLLVEIARRISSAIRHSDALVRWGGDEFLVVSRYTDREQAVSLPTRILNSLGREPIELEGGVRIRCTCSIGWAVFPWFVLEPGAVSYEDILRLADQALYEAKKAGRNQAVGMVPLHQSPTEAIPSGAGKSKRFSEQLSARMITTPGPAREGVAAAAAKAASASQRS